jgi:hypothetical protein
MQEGCHGKKRAKMQEVCPGKKCARYKREKPGRLVRRSPSLKNIPFFLIYYIETISPIFPFTKLIPLTFYLFMLCRVMNKRVATKWKYVLSLHLAGKNPKQISKETGYSTGHIAGILKDPDILKLREDLLYTTSQEFEILFEKVVDAISRGLQSKDERIALEAAQLWLKSHGKFIDETRPPQFQISAEDVVIQLLNQNIEEKKIYESEIKSRS